MNLRLRPVLLITIMVLSINTRAFTQDRSAFQDVVRVAQMRKVHQAFQFLQQREAEFKRLQIELVKVPAPPFGEGRRAEWLKNKFLELGLEAVEIDKVGNVLGLRRGADPKAKLLLVSAHIDTVFPAETDLQVRTEGNRIFAPGISDNGAGLIGLYATAAALKSVELPLNAGILFVGNVGEEGEGDLRGMRALFNESKYKNLIGHTIVLDGAGVDTVVTQALGSRRFEVVVRGPGGHSWSDHGAPNPIVAISRAIAKFSDAELPKDPKTATNIGVIQGGTSVNSIPESVSVRIDIRSSSMAEIEKLEKVLREAVASAVKPPASDARRPKAQLLTAEVKAIGNRPAAELSGDSRLLAVIRAVDAHLNLKSLTRRASTDANIPIAMGKEAVSIGAGGTGGGAHTVGEWYDPSGRDLGLKRIFLAVVTSAGVSE